MLAARLLDALLLDEQVALIDAEGRTRTCGPAGTPCRVALRLRRPLPSRSLLLSPETTLGEAYVRGDLVIESGTLGEVMDLAFRHMKIYREEKWPRLSRWRSRIGAALGRVTQINSRRSSAGYIHRHYDTGNGVFEAFLDPAMQYTCANFADSVLPEGTATAMQAYRRDEPLDLDLAQQRRMQAIVTKLGIRQGQRILDVGCGWGGLAIFIAQTTGAQVHGISISKEQIDYARKKAIAAGVGERVQFEFCDYRDLAGSFDRIVAAGILEHIGRPQYRRFFATLEACLAEDGVVLVDAAGRKDWPGRTNPWLQAHIFPGGYIPSLSEIARAVERTRLMIHDVEISAMQYALTVREWRRRFGARRDEIGREMGEEFVRMYDLYLAASEMAFVHGRHVNIQLVMSRSRFAVPLTRAAPV